MAGQSQTLDRAFLWIALALAFSSTACNKVPAGRVAVDAVDFRGTNHIDEDDIEDKIATTESSKFLGLFRGLVYEYSLFDRVILQRDLARIEAFYRTKGYYDAHARAGRVTWVDEKHVRVEVVIEEGEPVRVREIATEGLDPLPKAAKDAVQSAIREGLPTKQPFDEAAFDKLKETIRRTLADRAYATAKVDGHVTLDIVHHTADVALTVDPGRTCVFGPLTIEGNGKLSEKQTRRAVNIKEGDPYSEEELESARQAVLDLGVYAAATFDPKLADAAKTGVVPLTLRVEPSKLRAIRLGGGLEFDSLRTDVHGLAGWENRNLFGGMRSFRVTWQPGVVLYPLRVNNLEFPKKFLPESRLRFEFRQPSFPEARTNLFLRPSFDIRALLLTPNPPPDQPVIGYAESHNALGLERLFWRLYVGVSYNLQVAYPFAYVGPRDPTLGTLYISYPELLTTLDLRNDKIHPRHGIYISNTFQAAGGPFGGQATDIRFQPELRGFIPLSKRVVLAARGSVGFLFPHDYGEVVMNPQPNAPESAARTRDFQLVFFRGFFSGGPTSNRGYPVRGVGPHEVVPFLSPEAAVQRLAQCGASDTTCRSPTGGFTLWEASTEVRYDVTGPLALATFCDASDVSPQTANLRLTHLHLSCGAGVRYDTPAGPVRLDIGYRLPGLQVLGGLTPDELEPNTFLFGIPIAVHVGIGEAY